MATISNSDQENKELNVVETDKSAKEMMDELGIDIGVAVFTTELERALDINKLQSVGEMEDKQNNNANGSSSSNNEGGSTSSGGSVVSFVDTKAISHRMSDIRNNPAMAIPEGELDAKKKEAIEQKAKRSQEKAKEDKEASRDD